MQIRTQLATSPPWYTQLWPWLLMLGPFLVVLAGSYTAWLAVTRQDALVVGDYYKQGKAINQDLRRDALAAQLRLTSTLRYDAAAGVLSGVINSGGQPYRGALTLSLNHSTLPEMDIKLTLLADQNGAFSAALPLLAMVRWQVILEGGQRDWRLESNWKWPHQREAALQADALPQQ
jgi:hypothetical protein